MGLGGIDVEIGNMDVYVPFDGWTYCLYVSPQDAEAAQEMADMLLGVHEEEPPPIVSVEGKCPACGAAVSASATECPECHLVFGPEDSSSGDVEVLPDLDGPETDGLGLPTFRSGRRGR